MAVVASNYMTLADVIKQTHNGDVMSDIVEIMNESDSIIKDAHFKECNDGTTNVSAIRSGLPSAVFRALYGFVPSSKSETEQIRDNTGMLETYSIVDVDLIDKSKNPQQARLNEAKAFIEAMTQKLQRTILYGSTTGDEKAFNGLSVRYSKISTNKNKIGYNIIDAGGTGSDNTSAWFITWGEEATSLLYPEGSTAGLKRQNDGIQTETNSTGGKRKVYQEHFKQDVGLTVKDWRSTCRIANIDVNNLKAGTTNISDLLRKGYHKINKYRKRQGLKTFLYVTDEFLLALEKEIENKQNILLSYKNYGGEDVLHYRNIPVRPIDQILETEERVV